MPPLTYNNKMTLSVSNVMLSCIVIMGMTRVVTMSPTILITDLGIIFPGGDKNFMM